MVHTGMEERRNESLIHDGREGKNKHNFNYCERGRDYVIQTYEGEKGGGGDVILRNLKGGESTIDFFRMRHIKRSPFVPHRGRGILHPAKITRFHTI